MRADASAGWGVSRSGGSSPPAWWTVARWKFSAFFFLVFCVGEKSLVLVSVGEYHTLMALVRDNAALAVLWFSRRDGLNIQKTLPQRSRTPPSGCNTGRRGRRQREADGQHSVLFAWHLLLCCRKLRNKLQWDQRKRKKNPLKPTGIQKSRRNKCINLNDHWWLKSLKAIYANVTTISSTKACGEKGGVQAETGSCRLLEEDANWWK